MINIILCQDEWKRHYRADIIQELEVWLSSANTMLDIQDFIVKVLKLYLLKQSSNICTHDYIRLTKETFNTQLKIGWERMLTGLISKHIVELQHNYPPEMESKAENRWAVELINRV